MKLKSAILQIMPRDVLKAVVNDLEVVDVDRRSRDDMRDRLSKNCHATPDYLLEYLYESQIKEVCELTGIDSTGRKKVLVQRLLDTASTSSTEKADSPESETRRSQPDVQANAQNQRSDQAMKKITRKKKAEKKVTRYTYAELKEPRTPETGHTPLLPDDEQVVSLPMDNGWSQAIEVGKLPDEDNRPVVVDMDPAADPVLFWAGKRNRREVPVLPLQRNEIVSESRISHIIERARQAAAEKEGADRQGHLFADMEKELREGEKKRRVEFYTHDEGWKNKLICGDSLHVMESLLHYEGLRGKVQMIYVDPPYGIKYDSNFQQRVDSTRNDAKDQADDVLTIKAFRDTWTLGIHSYLSYLEERLYLCRELLSERGSIFIQIDENNVHRMRILLDEIFGTSNAVSLITFFKTSSQSSEFLSSPVDYLLWYAKDKSICTYHQLYLDKELRGEGANQYTWIELANGNRRKLSKEEQEGTKELPSGARVFRPDNLFSTRQARTHEIWPIEWNDRNYMPGASSTWKTNKEGIEQLKSANRLIALGKTLCYVRYLDDFPAYPLTSIWTDTIISGFSGEKHYAVQTSPKVVARCLAMTTAPGDLVLDITCGGGTTAYCAELLGRRWMSCDSSRVAINVTRKRLLSSVYPHYVQKGSRLLRGFSYRTLSRVTMGSITANREPEKVELMGPARGGQGCNPRLRPLRSHDPRPILRRGLEGVTSCVSCRGSTAPAPGR